MFSTGLLLQLLVGAAWPLPGWTHGARRLPGSAPTPTPRPTQGCVLWRNWWPMLTGVMYVLVPMPYLFFGAGSDSYGSSLASG
jgi:hypothetical protein